jgi:ankyrin repeat protein
VLVDWPYSRKSFSTNTEFTKLDGKIAIVRVDKLLEIKPGEKLGVRTFYFANDGMEREHVELDLKVWCLGRDPSSTFALASAIAARRIDGAFWETKGSSRDGEDGYGLVFDEDRDGGGDEDEGWEDVTVGIVGSSSDSGTSDGEGQEEFSDEDLVYPEDRSLSSFNPNDSDATENNNDEDNPDRHGDVRSYQSENEEDKTVIRHCAAWRSMWLRTSTRPQDMVFSTMHLIGASIEVDYDRSLPDLIFDLVKKTSSIPAWLTIGYDTPVMPSSGLIPEIPKFTPQSEPTYEIDGHVIPAAKKVSGDYRCYRFDIEIKSTDIKHGHLICARMLDVNEKRGPEAWTKDSAFDHQSDVRLTSPGYNLSTTCRFKGKMGSLVIIVGRRLADSGIGDFGRFLWEDYEPLVYLLDKNKEGVWQKTGGGTLMEELFGQSDEVGSIAWRHLRVGGEPGAEVEECDCGKAKPRKIRSVKPWGFQGQEAMDEALRKACYRGKEKQVRQLVCTGANPNAEGGEYAYALQAACIGGKDRIVEFLIESGADIHAKGGRFGNALQAAAFAGNHRIVRLLIAKGADINMQGGECGTALQAAADSQDNELSAKVLIDAGADVNVEAGKEGDALTAAASNGSVSLVEILLKHGADVRGKHGSPLIAAASCDEKRSLELVRILLRHGADPNAQSTTEARGGRRIVTALQSACQSWNYETVRHLLEHKADVNATGGDYWTALGAAAHYANLAICKLLIAYGADVNAQGGLWGTALQAAVTEEKPDPEDAAVIRLLIKHGADVNIRGGKYGSALQAAVHLKRGNRARLLVQAGASMDVDEEYAELLPKVLASGYERMVQRLIEKGSDANATGGRYGTALQAAAVNDARRLIKLLGGRLIGSRPIHGVSEKSHLRVVPLLVEKGAKVNVRGGYYGTALQATAYAGSAEVVRYLVMNGANVNTEGGRYGTALQAAARCGHEVIVKVLIQTGAKVNAKGGRFGTALQAASRYGHTSVAEYLIDAGANVDLGVDPSGESAVGLHGNALLAAAYYGTEMVEFLLSKGASINGVDDQGRNALHIAAAFGDCKLIDILLPLIYVGDARFSTDRLARTYFHHAAASGSVEAVDRFIALGIQKDAIDTDGWNALHWAARKGKKSVVRRLLEAGMDRAARTGVGTMTALRVAIFHKHLSLAPLLEVPSTSGAATPEPTAARTDLGTSIRQGVMEDPDGQIVGFQNHEIYCQGCKFVSKLT